MSVKRSLQHGAGRRPEGDGTSAREVVAVEADAQAEPDFPARLIGEEAQQAHGIPIGKEGRQPGKLVGVYRLGDIDMDVDTDKQGRAGGASNDGGFQFQVQALAVGKPGEKVELFFGTGCLDDAGKPTGGWGMGLGYSGRKHLGTVGTDIEAPIHEDDHQSFTVLRKNTHGEGEGVSSKKAPPGTPGH